MEDDGRFTRTERTLGVLIAGIVCVAAGSQVQFYFDRQDARAQAAQISKDREREREAADRKAERLEADIKELRTDRAAEIRKRDDRLAAVAHSTVRVRHDLEAQLSAARSDGQACVSRVAGIAEALGGVFDAVGEIADVAQELDRQNGRLKAENRKLTDQIGGLIANYKENHPERVTVTSPRR